MKTEGEINTVFESLKENYHTMFGASLDKEIFYSWLNDLLIRRQKEMWEGRLGHFGPADIVQMMERVKDVKLSKGSSKAKQKSRKRKDTPTQKGDPS